jgi:hypothetical protein
VITIVAPRYRAPATLIPTSKAVPEPTRDISDMNCSEWRDLQIGSGRVQVCE